LINLVLGKRAQRIHRHQRSDPRRASLREIRPLSVNDGIDQFSPNHLPTLEGRLDSKASFLMEAIKQLLQATRSWFGMNAQ
jgi:hypothetical protein